MKFKDFKSTNDLKKMSNEDLIELAEDIREILLEKILTKGGHLGSNLGVVELTISLLKNFDYKNSKFLYDTGYQSYAYKMLTDRKDFLEKKETYDGYSIFQEINEGDWYSGGHTSISAAWAGGYNLLKDNKTVIEIMGDGALASSIGLGGLLNFSPDNKSQKGLFIFNDNKQGIGLNKFNYLDWEKIATGMGYEYYLVNDGHNFDKLQKAWDFYNNSKKSVFVHIETIKAKGANIQNPEESMHYYIPPKPTKESSYVSSSKQLNNFFDKKMSKSNDVYCIIAGLTYAMGYDNLRKKYPNNWIDVGISEEIAIVQAAALAQAGKEVYVIMRPPFIQRCYDQFIHDIVRNNSNMTILIAYFGNIEALGDSHHAVYDIAMFNSFDSIHSFLPLTTKEFELSLEAAKKYKHTKVIRYPGLLLNNDLCNDINGWKKVIDNNASKVVITYSNECNLLEDYINKNNIHVDLICALTLNPIDKKMLSSLSKKELYFYEPVHGFNTLASRVEREFPNLKIRVFTYRNDLLGKWDVERIKKENKMDLDTFFKEIHG
ncbi:1-deoxy-D-xylulose-5-phosphate synthase N-terminal domain-containing protein [Spiroplasma endosymbiont of Aspidapion aeneum]|uniref:1-deoxy-D-xylulose-5-phosphate synthase N-terminal domain-containing protein n=1 Tax=Spiroplasma endosymbiont of Aspidapion aeneum TaxID=3066276 RepID=UPI00313F122C